MAANGPSADAMDSKTLEEAFTSALRGFLPKLQIDDHDARNRFFTKYRTEAEEFDKEFVRKYDDDLNVVLIFAGLFSAVSSAFVIDVQSGLSPDPNETTAALLRILIHTIDNSTFPGIDLTPPEWTGPPATAITVQSLLYASLFASLLSAFMAMLGKQWLNQYARVRQRGSAIDRSRDRQQKLNGMEQWRFHTVMESLPMMLQAALLLLGVALSEYVWTLDRAVATVILSLTAFGALFYIFVVISGAISHNCPFQTPLSLALYKLLADLGEVLALSNPASPFAQLQFSIIQVVSYISKTSASCWAKLKPDSGTSGAPVTPAFVQELRPMFLSTRRVDRVGDRRDTCCITWILETSTDAEMITAAAQFAVEGEEWPPEVDAVSALVRLRDSFRDCFDPVDGVGFLVPKLKAKAYASGKALLHLFVQRFTLNRVEVEEFYAQTQHMFDNTHLGSLKATPEMSSDQDMMSLITFMHHTFQDQPHTRGVIPGLFDVESVSEGHLSWLLHMLVYEAWQPDVRPTVFSFSSISHPRDSYYNLASLCISHRPLVSKSILADCLLVIGLTIGIEVHVDDLHIFDKSSELHSIMWNIRERLKAILCSRTPNPEEYERSCRILEVLQRLDKPTYQRNFDHWDAWSLELCQNVLELSNYYSNWKIARALLRIGFRDRKEARDVYTVEPKCIFQYLRYHYENPDDRDIIPPGPQSYHDALADGFEALGCNENVGLQVTEHPFLEVLCWALQSDKSSRLRNAAFMSVHAARNILFSEGTTQVQSDLLSLDFSPLLRSFLVETGCDPVNYNQILAELARSSVWHPRILGDQQIENRKDIASEWTLEEVHILSRMNYLDWSSMATKGDPVHKVRDRINAAWKWINTVDPDVLDQLVQNTLSLILWYGTRDISHGIDSAVRESDDAVEANPWYKSAALPMLQRRAAAARSVQTLIKEMESSGLDGLVVTLRSRANQRAQRIRNKR